MSQSSWVSLLLFLFSLLAFLAAIVTHLHWGFAAFNGFFIILNLFQYLRGSIFK